MEHEALLEAEEKMGKSLESFQQEISHIRTGRASTGLLDGIEVETYGSKMPLNQLATISAPEARLLTIQPWDKSQIEPIEKAILASPLDLTPANDGTIIRLPMPELSEERRKEYVKVVGKLAEDARISIRNIRRTEMEAIKKGQKSGEIPEDDAHKLTDAIQKITDEHIGKVDKAFKAKDAEIMEV
ncbi:MAG TPA: ribosome recycling factor [Candidatus Hydrogenedentes bacterium]|nr:ribosome recycling factor [Candidatus Hydrogenedentota bacterium]